MVWFLEMGNRKSTEVVLVSFPGVHAGHADETPPCLKVTLVN